MQILYSENVMVPILKFTQLPQVTNTVHETGTAIYSLLPSYNPTISCSDMAEIVKTEPRDDKINNTSLMKIPNKSFMYIYHIFQVI